MEGQGGAVGGAEDCAVTVGAVDYGRSEVPEDLRTRVAVVVVRTDGDDGILGTDGVDKRLG